MFCTFSLQNKCFLPQRRAFFRDLSFKKCSDMSCFVHFHFKMSFSPQRTAFFRHLNFKKCSGHVMLCTFSLQKMCFSPQRRAFFRHLNFKKYSGHVVFCTFRFKMCFSPQRRAFFRHLNFKKCSGHVMFCTFSLQKMCFFATAACIFSTSELQKVLRTRHVLYIFTSK